MNKKLLGNAPVFAPVILAVLALWAGIVLANLPAPDTTNSKLDDIPPLFYFIDLGWTLITLSGTIFLFLIVQMIFKKGSASIYATPKKPAIFIYVNVSLMYLVALGSIGLLRDLDRGYFPTDADSIGIPIFGLMLLYFLFVGPINALTFFVLRNYHSGLLPYNPYGKSSKASLPSKLWFGIVSSILTLGFLSSFAYAAFDSTSISLLILISAVYGFYGLALSTGRIGRKAITINGMMRK